MSENKKLSVTVGIYTCYGGLSLVRAVESVRASEGGSDAKILVVADGQPLTEDVSKKLNELDVDVREQPGLSPQAVKIRKIISLCDTDILILTQDDVIFEKSTVKEIIKKLENDQKLTMISTKFMPIPAMNFFESAMGVQVRMHDYITKKWNGGHNYMASSGRCLAFRLEILKRFRIPEKIVNLDTYFYFENKRLNGIHEHQPRAVVYTRCPQTIADQIGPSNRYQYSQKELINFFDFDLAKEYKIPLCLKITAFLKEFFSSPTKTAFYSAIYFYTRLNRKPVSEVLKTNWKIDESTKK